MTAREALQALVDGSNPEVKYSPVDRVKAIALLLQVEEKETSGDGFGQLLKALDASAIALANSEAAAVEESEEDAEI